MKCKFYGRHTIPRMGTIVDSFGNQCALIVEAFAPCRMEIAGQEPDFEQCELNGSARAAQFEGYKIIERSK